MRYKWPLAYQTSASIFIMFSLIQCVSFSFLLSLSVSWARTRYNFQRSGESALSSIFQQDRSRSAREATQGKPLKNALKNQESLNDGNSYTGHRSCRNARPSCAAVGLAALGARNQSQGYWNALSDFFICDASCRRRDGAADPGGAVQARPADHAGFCRFCELDAAITDRRIRYGVRTDEQLQLLAVAAGSAAALRFLLDARRRAGVRLDDVCAFIDPDGAGDGFADFCDPYHGRIIDYGRDQYCGDHFEYARAWDELDENADVRMDLAGDRLSAAGGDTGAGGRGDDAAVRPPFRHFLFQRGGRRGPGAVSAYFLVFRAS